VALIVQKYGGTSVGSIERIRNVAGKAVQTRKAGHDLVVVVSAMAGGNRPAGQTGQGNG
jgi:aspartate kinase